MKKAKILVCCLLLCLLLTGCKDAYNDSVDTVSEVKIGDIEFKVIPGVSKKYGGYNILVDKNTRVQYLVNYEYGTEVLVDTDGKPILYKGEIE